MVASPLFFRHAARPRGRGIRAVADLGCLLRRGPGRYRGRVRRGGDGGRRRGLRLLAAAGREVERGKRRGIELAGRLQALGTLEVLHGGARLGTPAAVDVVANVEPLVVQLLLHLEDRIRSHCVGSAGRVGRLPAAVGVAAGGARDILVAAVDDGLGGEIAAGLAVASLEVAGRRHAVLRAVLRVLPGYGLPGRGMLERAADTGVVGGIHLAPDIAAGERTADDADRGQERLAPAAAELVAANAAERRAAEAADDVALRRAEDRLEAAAVAGAAIGTVSAVHLRRGRRRIENARRGQGKHEDGGGRAVREGRGWNRAHVDLLRDVLTKTANSRIADQQAARSPLSSMTRLVNMV